MACEKSSCVHYECLLQVYCKHAAMSLFLFYEFFLAVNHLNEWLFTINLLIFQNPSSLCHKPSVLQGLFSCPFIFFSCWLTGLRSGCSHFPHCVMKRQHLNMSKFQFTLGFQGSNVSFSVQQTLALRIQLSDICKIHLCQLCCH